MVASLFLPTSSSGLRRSGSPATAALAMPQAIWTLVFLALITAATLRADEGSRLFIDLRLEPDAAALTAYDVNILRPDAKVDLEPGRSRGNQFFAHLGLLDMPLSQRAAREAAKLGFSGFVFVVSDRVPAEEQIATLQGVRSAFPDKAVFLTGAFRHLRAAWSLIDGVLAQGVFQTLDEESGEIRPVAQSESLPLQKALVDARRAGLITYVMDFSPREDAAAMTSLVGHIRALGAAPFVTDDPLGGAIVGPLQERDRSVLVIHGWNPAHLNGKTSASEATITGRRLHAPLEWLGYRLRYLDLGRQALPTSLHGLSAVILDGNLLLTRHEQAQLAEWVGTVARGQVPLLLTGQPWTDPGIFAAAAEALRLTGSGQKVPGLTRISVSRLNSEMTGGSTTATPSRLDFIDLQAPEDAEVFLSLKGTSGLNTQRFDPAFLTRWGGVLIEAEPGTESGAMNEIAFLRRWLEDVPAFPIPDTTTRDGRRLLLLQAQSEGFSSVATIPGLFTCGELMKSRVLDCYKLPFTVGLCEAELRGWLPGLDPRDGFRYQETARQILSLPQVEPASGSFSRPNGWRRPENGNPDLNPYATDDRDGLGRQIAGSLAYLHREVLPSNRRLRFMQWPEMGPPSLEAATYARKMGALSLAPETAPVDRTRTFGGEGVKVIRHTFLTASSPETAFREGADALRLTPLRFSFRFDDARTDEKLSALKRRLDLCAAQALQPVTAGNYVHLVEDAHETRILEVGEGHWMLLNKGNARTFRLPASAGVPHLQRCRGVSGYDVRGDQIYIHTLGAPATELVMTDSQLVQDHVYLRQASSALRFHQLSTREVEFEFSDLRPGDATFAGLQPESVCHIRLNGRQWSVLASASGLVSLELPPQGHAHILISPPAYAASR